MKLLTYAVISLALLGCDKLTTDTTPARHDPGYIHIDDRKSLPIIFELNHKKVDELLEGKKIEIYSKSLVYSFENANDGTVVKWTGPDKKLNGTVTLFATGEKRKAGCRSFQQELILGETVYTGFGKGCYVNNHWVIKLK